MKDIKKLFNYLTGLQERVLEELLLNIEPNVTTALKLTDIAEELNTTPKDVRKTLKILTLIELLEYESFNGKGVAVKIIDLETFNKPKKYFSL